MNQQVEGVGLGATPEAPKKEEFVVLPTDSLQEATKKRFFDRAENKVDTSWMKNFKI